MSAFLKATRNSSNDFLRVEPRRDEQKNVYEPYPVRPDIVWAGLWPQSRSMGGDVTANAGSLGSDASNTSGAYEYPMRMLAGSLGRGGFFLSGITRDQNGDPLGNVTVQGYLTATEAYQGVAISDFAGYYVWVGQYQQPHYLVAYLPGAPDVAGTTVNTLIPTTVRTY